MAQQHIYILQPWVVALIVGGKVADHIFMNAFNVILKMSTGVWNSFRQRRPSADQGTLGKSQQPKTDKIASNSKSSPTNLSLDVEAAQSVLQQFDLASKYGPCRGMTRMERWNRAQSLGLDPPPSVRELLLQDTPEGVLSRCCFD
ncbi:hypothetical protein H632_c787p0 [Helicosporidium sp. ATCC 50920]|nr:hypothetical protein H632_c787p0 [Helicosporidium sp. ATCC 50920]|eukprot:KDD75247.1 hypothetical protein H632_c787p0 [Helicosporidium sp. ATCC 50920]